MVPVKTKSLLRIALVGCVLASATAGQAAGGGSQDVDYNQARREIQGFEAAVDNTIGSTFGNPFALVQKTKGVYLQGYGVMFDFLINIHRAVITTPFGQVRRDREINPAEKRRRIGELKDKLVRLLTEKADTLRQMRKEDSVTIVAFLEDSNFPDEESQTKTIVLRAFKRDLDDLGHKPDGWRELLRKMEITEY